MEEYRIKILPSAQIDVLDIAEHFNVLPPDTACETYDSFIEQLNELAVFPERCALAKDTQLRLRGYRTLAVGDYTAFFVIRSGTVEIRRVLYTKRQMERLCQ